LRSACFEAGAKVLLAHVFIKIVSSYINQNKKQMEQTTGTFRRVKELVLIKCDACTYEFVFANYKGAGIPKWTECPHCKRQIILKK
jgi:hypothetical protein